MTLDRHDINTSTTQETHFIYDAVVLIDDILGRDSDLGNVFQFGMERTFHLFSGDIFIDIDNKAMFDFALFDVDLNQLDVKQVFEIKYIAGGVWELTQTNRVSTRLSQAVFLSPRCTNCSTLTFKI